LNPDAYLEMAQTESSHWWFVARRSILAALIARLRLPAGARILEVGSGTGGNLEMLATFGEVSALEMDASARAIAALKTGARFDIRAGSCPSEIPFEGAQFDLICMFDVLEHIDADQATLVALKRLLAPGGRLLLTVPAYQWLWSAHDAFLHHKRRYALRELRAKLAAAGLQAIRISYFNSLLLPLVIAVRLRDRLLRRTEANGAAVPAPALNALLRLVFGSERYLLRAVNLPFGLSLFALTRAA
jgi:SAM-dependent methyltransferase